MNRESGTSYYPVPVRERRRLGKTDGNQAAPTVPAAANGGGIRPRALALVLVFGVGLILIGRLRAAGLDGGPLAEFAGLATPLYVGLTIATAMGLINAGADFTRFGFEIRFAPRRHLGLAAAGAVMLFLLAELSTPLLGSVFGEARDLDRFASVAGSPAATLKLLLFSWTFAAFGEEIALRIVLMRGLIYALGNGRFAVLAALVLQAVVFGLVHVYQGPAGVAGTFMSGLVYGVLVLLARGSIWPAALAHGTGNTIGILSLYVGS